MAFEEHLKQLREVTQKLEEGSLPLEEAVTLYTEGVQLATQCQEELKTAKLQIQKQSIMLQEEEEDEHGSEA